jgi:hypothetical protein
MPSIAFVENLFLPAESCPFRPTPDPCERSEPISSFGYNQTNADFVHGLIQEKNVSTPFWATADLVGNVITDRDKFPYNRSFRGVYNSATPIIAEREAGWREIDNQCYKSKTFFPSPYPEHCFQFPCSTVFRCIPKHESEFAFNRR